MGVAGASLKGRCPGLLSRYSRNERRGDQGVYLVRDRAWNIILHVTESRMRSSRQRGDQKRLRDIATCSPMPSLLGEDKGGIVKSRPQVHLAGNRLDCAQVCVSLLQVSTSWPLLHHDSVSAVRMLQMHSHKVLSTLSFCNVHVGIYTW